MVVCCPYAVWAFARQLEMCCFMFTLRLLEHLVACSCHVLRTKVFWCDPLHLLLWTFFFEPGKCHGMCPQLRFAIPIRCERRFPVRLDPFIVHSTRFSCPTCARPVLLHGLWTCGYLVLLHVIFIHCDQLCFALSDSVTILCAPRKAIQLVHTASCVFLSCRVDI